MLQNLSGLPEESGMGALRLVLLEPGRSESS